MSAGRRIATALAFVLTLVLLGTGVWAYHTYNKIPIPFIDDQCRAATFKGYITLDLEQAQNAAIITGVSINRGLPGRAASIALATAYQESGIRNLSYGDRDSVGLFQQRPSQGWGTVAELMDPVYASNAFYDALLKIPDWRSRDINDVAQAVQKSAYADGYRRHVDNAQNLASVLTGYSPKGLTCLIRSVDAGNAKGLATFLTTVMGRGALSTTVSGNKVKVTTSSTQNAWAVSHLSMAVGQKYGLERVDVGGYYWKRSVLLMSDWQGSGSTDVKQVTLTVAA